MSGKVPIIGITTCIRTFKENDQPIMGAKTPYIDALTAGGAIPLLIPLIQDKTHLKNLFTLIDGLLLPGGEDVDPAIYSEAPHPKLGDISRLRDEVEIELIKLAYNKNIPVLGICRGLQVINVALGGSLYQDIPTQCQSTVSHRSSGNSLNWNERPHTITIEESSLLSTIIQKKEIGVNSLHHQAIKDLAKKVRVSARSQDGIIEAIESDNKDFFIALQCHPEMMWQNESPQVWGNLFHAFIKACS